MPIDIIVRRAPSFEEEGSSKQLKTYQANEDPIAYQNLSIVKRMGRGKFPTYLTTSRIDNQYYVMKVFSEVVKDSQMYYENEVRFASLSHPNIVNIVSSNPDRGNAQRGKFSRMNYVVSKYEPHGDLFDFIIKHKKEIDEKLARTLFRQLIEGLEYLHTIGVAHLDLKPENILIGADFTLKIADFDLSQTISDANLLGRGTRVYRGPEFYNSDFDFIQLESPAAADIYSAAVILFLLKCGGVFPHTENRVVGGVNFTELLEKDINKFWDKHTELQRKPRDFFDHKFRSLFRKMVRNNPKDRANVQKIKRSKWYNGPVYTPQEYQEKMKAILKC